MLDRSEKVLDLLLPKVDHPAIEKRIANYVQKILAGFQRVSKRNTELWKAIFRAIDDASKGDNNKWFRILVADIDSNAFAAAADAESAKLFKKLDGSSKLFINNLQQLSRRFYKRREAIRERVKNAIRHIPKVGELYYGNSYLVVNHFRFFRLILMVRISNSYFQLDVSQVVMLEIVS